MGGPNTLGQPQHVALEVFNVGGWLTHGDLALEAGVHFLAVVEHRFGVNGPGSRVRVLLLSGLLLVRIPLMLVMLVLGLRA